jgi:NAD(P)H dehydrogenase (quinone)
MNTPASNQPFAITGITGKVGGSVADHLLRKELPVRAVVRSEEKGRPWRERGCEVAVAADSADASALARAFANTRGVFLMNPPNYDAAPDFSDVRRFVETAATVIAQARPGRIVLLSTVGAQATEFNLLNWAGFFESMLRESGVPVALLRAAWFMENAAWDVAAARQGRIASYLQPPGRAIEMVATADIGRVAAELLRGEQWNGTRIVELGGPRRYSPEDVAAGFATVLGHRVEVTTVPRDTWETRFRAEGMRHPQGRIRMLDGFNEGWIDFEGGAGTEQVRGTVTLEEVLRQLCQPPTAHRS